jgi:arginase
MRIKPATASRIDQIPTVEVACDAGARRKGSGEGPGEFRKSRDAALRCKGLALAWQQMPRNLCAPESPPLQAVAQTARWTAGITRRLTAGGEKFIVIGGDHSCAIGTWSGVADALRKYGPLGLIWIDAHMDMHVPETTHSGAINGMPVASLLGYGAPELTSVAEDGPALHPHHICLVGTRSFEPEEVEFAERFAVRVIGMQEVRVRGIDAALAEAHEVASSGTAGYGISLDLDAFDPAEAPGVGTPEPGGILPATIFDAWSELCRDPKCLGIEIVEFNPSLDQAGRTAQLLEDFVTASIRLESAP